MTTITKKNEIFLKVEAEPHLHKELSEHFQFEVPGAKYMPAVKESGITSSEEFTKRLNFVANFYYPPRDRASH